MFYIEDTKTNQLCTGITKAGKLKFGNKPPKTFQFATALKAVVGTFNLKITKAPKKWN